MKILGRIKKSKVLTAVMTAVLIFQSACPTGLAYAAQKSGVSAYAAGQTIDQALGATKTVESVLSQHENDEYYLTTPYGNKGPHGEGGAIDTWDCWKPKGEYGSGAYMNCAGFVVAVLRACGADTSIIGNYTAMDGYEHYLFISLLFLFMSGMRLGEASALLWSDIDFTTGLCSITKTLYYHNQSDYKFTKPKTRAAIRSIYLDEDTLSELAAWRKVQRVVIPDCEFVLSYNGLPTTKTRLPRAMKKLADLAGVHRVRVHDLRHSHASLLINMGESPLLLKERLGHEKIQTTLGTYGHLYPNTNQAVAKKLTGILNYSEPKTSIANYTSNQHTADYHRA